MTTVLDVVVPVLDEEAVDGCREHRLLVEHRHHDVEDGRHDDTPDVGRVRS